VNSLAKVKISRGFQRLRPGHATLAEGKFSAALERLDSRISISVIKNVVFMQIKKKACYAA
jgi:hypothetical protein